mgnify:CR=1 FL=1
MKKINYIAIFVFSLTILFTSCQENDFEFGEIIAPSNILISEVIVGVDSNNPYGDGSGTVHFTASADNAVSYKFVYNGDETVSLSGKHTYNFSNLGVNTYTVTVVASGTAGVTSNETIQVEVLSTYKIPDDLLTMLTDNSSRTWRIKSESSGHFGVGPADETSPIWYGAGPDEKAGLGMYDDRYTFGVNESFTHTTNGNVFGKEVPLQNTFGASSIAPNSNDEIENYVLDDYTSSWSLTAPGGVETLTLTNNGFCGFYVGSSSFVIISRSANEMVLRTTGFDGLGWFITLIAE